jgi:hypothetical protein
MAMKMDPKGVENKSWREPYFVGWNTVPTKPGNPIPSFSKIDTIAFDIGFVPKARQKFKDMDVECHGHVAYCMKLRTQAEYSSKVFPPLGKVTSYK